MIESPWLAAYRRLFKPPPWRLWGASARALPDFILIGAMRGGTTSLHDHLCRHPEIAPPIKKEIHFFDLEFERGLDWYRAHFPRRSELARAGWKTGEASPYYLSHPLAAQRAGRILPGARLVAVLRNPVDRAYSHYWHSVRLGVEPLSFEDAIAQESARLEGEEARIVDQPGYRSRSHQHQAYVTRSLYERQLRTWLAHFPREQVFVLESESLQADFERQFPPLLDFLGLSKGLLPARRALNRAQYPPMNPDVRIQLQEFFEPHNARLFELIGESFDW